MHNTYIGHTIYAFTKLTTFSAAVFLINLEPWPGLPGQVMVNPSSVSGYHKHGVLIILTDNPAYTKQNVLHRTQWKHPWDWQALHPSRIQHWAFWISQTAQMLPFQSYHPLLHLYVLMSKIYAMAKQELAHEHPLEIHGLLGNVICLLPGTKTTWTVRSKDSPANFSLRIASRYHIPQHFMSCMYMYTVGRVSITSII